MLMLMGFVLLLAMLILEMFISTKFVWQRTGLTCLTMMRRYRLEWSFLSDRLAFAALSLYIFCNTEQVKGFYTMATTLSDICRLTGLSSATVSRVINNSPLVKEVTRKKVQDVIDELNYFPLPSARVLAGKRTGTIGIISPYGGSGFFSDIMVGVDQVAAERGVHVMMSFAHGLGDEVYSGTQCRCCYFD